MTVTGADRDRNGRREEGRGAGILPPSFRRPLVVFALLMLVLTLGRAALLLVYGQAFDELGSTEIARGFVHGLRFDLSVVLLLAGLPLWLLALPARWARRDGWQRFWSGVLCVLLLILFWGTLADLVYFSITDRHAGSELLIALESDWRSLVWAPLEYPVLLTLFLLASGGLLMLWPRLPRVTASDPAGSRWHAAAWLALVPLLVIGGRGGLQGKPINIVNAFEYGSVQEGYLTLNGPFSVIHSTRNTDRGISVTAFAPEVAEQIVRGRFELDEQRWESDTYPLERSTEDSDDPPPPPRNVVILVLESWDALVTDSIRVRHGLPPLGLTPTFDALAGEGLLLSRFHANGQMSIEGITALIASVPTIPGLPYMGRGMEQSRLSFLGDLASEEGLGTVFVRSADRASFRLDAVSALAGFDVYAGAEDILKEPSHTTEPSSYWGAWDYDSMRYFHERLLETGEPFVGMFFGSSTHQPYPSPGEQWTKMTGDSREDHYRNAVHYVDWALGRYLEMAKEAGYYDETLFVILADETSAHVDVEDPPDSHWIPALLVGPGIPEGSVDDRVASQMDILPTIVDYMGWDEPHASFGESLLGERRPAALLKSGETMIRMGSDGWILHDLTRRLEGEGPDSIQDALERSLLAEVQLVSHLLSTNRIYSGN